MGPVGLVYDPVIVNERNPQSNIELRQIKIYCGFVDKKISPWLIPLNLVDSAPYSDRPLENLKRGLIVNPHPIR